MSDEPDDGLWHDPAAASQARVVVACGDLPFDYLEWLTETLDAPLAFVPGNHDPDVSGYSTARSGLSLRSGLPAEPPWPPGAHNVDGRVAEVGGLVIAGLGGCLRYGAGPNQYTERQYRWRVRRLRVTLRRRSLLGRRPVDLVLSHAPPAGLGDREDRAHRGIPALSGLIDTARPAMLLHGHVHPYGETMPDRRIGQTVIRNVVGWHLLDVAGGGARRGA